MSCHPYRWAARYDVIPALTTLDGHADEASAQPTGVTPGKMVRKIKRVAATGLTLVEPAHRIISGKSRDAAPSVQPVDLGRVLLWLATPILAVMFLIALSMSALVWLMVVFFTPSEPDAAATDSIF